MAEPNIEEDLDISRQMTQILMGQDSDILKVTAGVNVKNDQVAENDEDGMEHEEAKKTDKMCSKRAPKKKFARLISESKSLLKKDAMYEEASEEDKAWLTSLTDVEVDMLISIKKMAMERAKTIQDERVKGIFNFKVLRTIGVLLLEFIKDRLKNANFPAKVFETKNSSPEKNEGRLPLEREGERNDIRPIVKAELEVSATNNMKRKRDILQEQEEIHLKKQKIR